MRRVHLDFETRSKVNIFDAGAYRYAEDPSTEILCIAYAVDDEPVQIITRRDMETICFEGSVADILFKLAYAEDTIFVAHNAYFEQVMWKHKMTYSFPDLPPERWRCTAAKARANGLPASLDHCSQALRLEARKDGDGKKVMLKLCKPRNPTLKDPRVWHEDPADFEKLYAYCMQDVEVERQIDKKLRELNEFEQKLWFLDQKINMRGLQIDMELAEAAIFTFSQFKEKKEADILKLTNGFLDGASKLARMSEWLKTRGIEVDNLQKATVTALLEDKTIADDVRFILDARRQLGKTSIAKFLSMRYSANADKRIRDILIYHGASTGRWTGKLVQFHNLPKGNLTDMYMACDFIKMRNPDILEMVYPDIGMAISSCIRGAVISKPGFDLMVGDFASIEARIVLWLAGEEGATEMLRNGADIYKDMATFLYNIKLSEVTKEQRQLSKAILLGCGYGMGFKKFRIACESQGLVIDENLAWRSVNAYRKKYAKVPKIWNGIGNATVEAIETRKKVDFGRLSFLCNGDFLYIKLPSKRLLTYFKPGIDVSTKQIKRPVTNDAGELTFVNGVMQEEEFEFTSKSRTYWAVDSLTKQFKKQHCHGSLTFENISQAIARDIMAEAMVRCEDAGYPIIMTVHDELVCEIPEGFGSVEEFDKLMSTLPSWADGCPIGSESWRGKRYKK